MPKVSVIIPCYNQAKFLPQALQSILNQTHQNWECIIVNDGSPDDAENVGLIWCNKDSRIKYISQKNGGLSNARNLGIRNATSDFILTLDADDKYASTFIEKALGILNENKEIGIVSSWGIRFMEDKLLGEFRPTGKSLKDFLFCNAAIGTSLFRKECWEKVGGYDENMKTGYEDWEFYIRVCKLNWNVHIIKEVLFFYRQHEVSMRTIAIENHDLEIKKHIYLKHKELCKENFEDIIFYFLESIETQKKENLKIQNRIDYRIGTFVLKPFRSIKSFFKK